MGSKKKTAPRKSTNKRAREVLALSRKARAEVEMLLKRDRTGDLTRAQLMTGLEEVDCSLKRMLGMIRFFL
jgi:hypothetical protein